MTARRHSRIWPACLAVLLLLAGMVPVRAHHVLGRPSYSLNEDSNTPPAMQVETQIGDYFVNYMVYPAFPKPGEPGRISLYATHLENSKPFGGKVTFSVGDNSWSAFFGLGAAEEELGIQPPDDNVFRQGFLFKDPGDYTITATFADGGEPYRIDFPLRIGPPSRIGPIGIAVGVLLLVLAGVSLIQRRRAMTGKVRSAHDRAEDSRTADGGR